MTVSRTETEPAVVELCMVGEHRRAFSMEQLHVWLDRMWRVNNCPRMLEFKGGSLLSPFLRWLCSGGFFLGFLEDVSILLGFESHGAGGVALP